MNSYVRLVVLAIWTAISLTLVLSLADTTFEPFWLHPKVFAASSFVFSLYFLIKQAVRDAYTDMQLSRSQ